MGKEGECECVNDKATYPNLYGLDKSKEKLEELTQSAVDALASITIMPNFLLILPFGAQGK